MRNSFKRGSGIMILGSMMLVICTMFFVMFAEEFVLTQRAMDTQMAVDSLSDSVAFKMSQIQSILGFELSDMTGINEYDCAADYSEEVNDKIYDITAVDLMDAGIDEGKIKDGIIDVTASASWLDPILLSRPEFTITRAAATQYKGLFGDDYIRLGQQICANPRVGYSQVSRCFVHNGGACWDVDCSSFVYACLYYTGYLGGTSYDPFCTDDMVGILLQNGFVEVPIDQAQRGDILHVYASERGSSCGHTEFYMGNGVCMGAQGNYDGSPCDSGDGSEVSVHMKSTGRFRRALRFVGPKRPGPIPPLNI